MSNCSNLWGMRNFQEQVKKVFCYQKLFWPFTVWINCSSDLKIIANSQPSALNFKSFSRKLGQFFLTVGQFGNKIPFSLFFRFYVSFFKNDIRSKTLIWSPLQFSWVQCKYNCNKTLCIIINNIFLMQLCQLNQINGQYDLLCKKSST